MYPSGQIYLQNFESVVGKKAAHAVVSDIPENVRIVTVRTTGLWGSSFSKAFEGDSPNLVAALGRGVLAIFSNLVVFLKRRDVRVVIEDRTEELKTVAGSGLSEFNANLENWYNAHGPEKCVFLPYFPFFDSYADRTEPDCIPGSLADMSKSSHSGAVDAEVLRGAIAEISKIKPEADAASMTAETRLAVDLEFDSLDTAELKIAIGKRFENASNPPVSFLKSV